MKSAVSELLAGQGGSEHSSCCFFLPCYELSLSVSFPPSSAWLSASANAIHTLELWSLPLTPTEMPFPTHTLLHPSKS